MQHIVREHQTYYPHTVESYHDEEWTLYLGSGMTVVNEHSFTAKLAYYLKHHPLLKDLYETSSKRDSLWPDGLDNRIRRH